MPEIFGEEVDFDTMSDEELKDYLDKLQLITAARAPKKREPKAPKAEKKITRIEL